MLKGVIRWFKATFLRSKSSGTVDFVPDPQDIGAYDALSTRRVLERIMKDAERLEEKPMIRVVKRSIPNARTDLDAAA